MGEIVTQLFAAFGGSAILIIVAAILGNKVLDSHLKRDDEAFRERLRVNVEGEIEKFRHHLQRETDQEIERVKANLRVEAFRRETTFSRMHEKQVEVLAEVYSKLHYLLQSVQGLIQEFGGEATMNKDELYGACDKANHEFKSAFYPNRIFVPDPLDDQIKVFSYHLISTASKFKMAVGRQSDPHRNNDEDDPWERAEKEIEEKANPVFSSIRDEVRRILTVDSAMKK